MDDCRPADKVKIVSYLLKPYVMLLLAVDTSVPWLNVVLILYDIFFRLVLFTQLLQIAVHSMMQ